MKTLIRILLAVAFTVAILNASGQTLIAHPAKTPIGIYPYWEYKPDSAKNLLIFVHGHGERGNGTYFKDPITGKESGELMRVLNIGIPKLIKAGQWKWKDFIGIFVQYGADKAYLYPPTFHSFILSAQKYYGIDRAHTFLVGISGGGISVNKLINDYNDAEACLTISGGFDLFKANAVNTRLWVVHGEDDTTIPPTSARNFVSAYNKAVPIYFARLELQVNYAHEPGVWDRACSRDKYFQWMLKP